MGGRVTEGVPGPIFDAGGDQDFGRESGEGSWEERDQEPPPSHNLFGEGERSSERSLGSPTSPSCIVDETHGSRDPNLGATIGGVSKTSGLPDGTSEQSSKRNHGDKPDYPTTQPHGRRHISTTSRLYPGHGCGGQCGRDSRQGRGNDEKQPSGCAQELCRISWSGHRFSQDHRDCGRCRGARGRQTIKKAAIIGAISLQTCFVSLGPALGVECNPWHGACTWSVTDVCTDAYWSSFAVTDAACAGMDSSYQPFLSWTHSVIHEKRFVDPLQAVMDAFCLQWEVIKMCYNEFGRMFDTLHIPTSPPLARSQRSHSMRHRDLHVGFVDQIDVFIGSEDSLDMHHIHLHSSALQDWTDKPWSKKRIKVKKNRKGSPDGDPIQDCPEVFHFPFSFPTLALEPLSKLAVSSRAKGPQYDGMNLMQISHFKHAPHSEQDAAMVETFAGGQTVLQPQSDNDDAGNSGGSSADSRNSRSGSSDSSGIQPPRSVSGRQEVIMFHLRDPPLRALLDWSDYDSMITEIAHHFATVPINVVDAYEINSDLPGTLPEAVPIIVHLLPDIPVGQSARLALFDLEFHKRLFILGLLHSGWYWSPRNGAIVVASLQLLGLIHTVNVKTEDVFFGTMEFAGKILTMIVDILRMEIIFVLLCHHRKGLFVPPLRLWI